MCVTRYTHFDFRSVSVDTLKPEMLKYRGSDTIANFTSMGRFQKSRSRSVLLRRCHGERAVPFDTYIHHPFRSSPKQPLSSRRERNSSTNSSSVTSKRRYNVIAPLEIIRGSQSLSLRSGDVNSMTKQSAHTHKHKEREGETKVAPVCVCVRVCV